MYYLIITPIILVVFCMLMLLIFGHDWYNCITSYLPTTESYTNSIRSPTTSRHYNNYIESIHPSIYPVKLPKFENFSNDHRSSIKHLPPKYREMIRDYISRADYVVKKWTIFNKYPWKIYASYNNLEMNMPFTLADTIIIPINKLDKLFTTYRHGHYDNNFINILIHEKLHVIQRRNQSKFDSFYRICYKSFLGIKYQKPLPVKLQMVHMNNPDSNNSIWLFTFNKKQYIPLLTYDAGIIKTIGYNKDFTEDTIDLNYMRNQLGYGNDISFYHPNEIFACDVTHHIMDKTLPTYYSKFLNSI
jgi:hypothetical protein